MKYDFSYYYPLDDTGSPMWLESGHIMIKPFSEDYTLFLCGAKKDSSVDYKIQEQAMVGRKLCHDCMAERDRLLTARPTEKMLLEWWNGGIDEFREERKKLTIDKK